MTLLETLRQRGFIKQLTSERDIDKLFTEEKVVYYTGFDPTADSLHIGSLVPIMAMAHLQKAGHTPIAIIGGGTAMVGDPSGKTEMRKLISQQEIQKNGEGILSQLNRYLNLGGSSGIFLNNAEWLLELKYIDFLREIGRFFKVNEMIRAEAYRQRLEREDGLSFVEFNYQLLQAYDFLVLFEKFKCKLQMGGDDQWGNMLAGSDLIRRVLGSDVHCLTFPLLTTARGRKMGKTESGTVWLDAKRTSPYDFYQYWINTDDRDVIKFLLLFTFLSVEEVSVFGNLEGQDLRRAKEVLAFEVTKLAHGEKSAREVAEASLAAFYDQAGDLSNVPTTAIPANRISSGINVVDLFCEVGLSKTKSDARRLISQGGAYMNGTRVESDKLNIDGSLLQNGAILLKAGKKRLHRIVVR